MKKTLTTLSTIVALGVPMPAEAILGAGSCIEKYSVKVEVQKGDTLIDLVMTYYGGDGSKYIDLARHNKIKDPNQIRIGQVLELPGKYFERWRPISVSDYGSAGGYCSR